MVSKEELVVGLYDRGALEFVIDKDDWMHFQSGQISSHYFRPGKLTSIDKESPNTEAWQFRVLTMTVAAFSESVRVLRRRSEGEQWPDHLYGLPETMTPLAPLVGSHLGLSVLWGRRTVDHNRMHPSKQRIVGDYHAGENVVMLDNALTTGDTATREAAALSELGMRCVGLAALMDLERSGIAVMEQHGVDTVAYFGLTEAVAYLRENGRIGQAQIDAVNASRAVDGHPEITV